MYLKLKTNRSLRTTMLSLTGAAMLVVSGCTTAGAQSSTTFSQDKTSVSATLKPGAIVEIVYLDADRPAVKANTLERFETSADRAGGDFVAGFEIIGQHTQDRNVSHTLVVQWPDANTRTSFKNSGGYSTLNASVLDYGFFSVQQDTPISLSSDKMYDFTNAWTVAETPEQMGAIMKVLGVYFSKLAPITESYGISGLGLMAAHPAGAKLEASIYSPQINGLFEWQSYDDVKRFQNDPDFLEIVDIRNATFKRPEDSIYMKLLP